MKLIIAFGMGYFIKGLIDRAAWGAMIRSGRITINNNDHWRN
jgi:hypothetical protein